MNSLAERISSEIDRLSSSHQEEDINLINNVLRPMLIFIQDHNKLVAELNRIGSKHTL
jgi:hypothetical protein